LFIGVVLVKALKDRKYNGEKCVKPWRRFLPGDVFLE
jgi:hypothetical protein